MVLGGAFGRCLGYEVRALMNGISVRKKETPENSVSPYTEQGHPENTAVWEPEGGLPIDSEAASTLTLEFPVSNKCLCKPLGLRYLVKAARADEASTYSLCPLKTLCA